MPKATRAQWFMVATHGPRFQRQFSSVSQAKKWTERHIPLKRGWSMSWTYSHKTRWWALTVVNSKGRKVNSVGLRRIGPDEVRH